MHDCSRQKVYIKCNILYQNKKHIKNALIIIINTKSVYKIIRLFYLLNYDTRCVGRINYAHSENHKEDSLAKCFRFW